MENTSLRILHDKAVLALQLHMRAKYGYYRMNILGDLAQGVLDLEQEVKDKDVEIKALQNVIARETTKAQEIITRIQEADKRRHI